MNSITLMGRLTRDPELRQTDSGIAVCSFSVAVDRRGKERNTDFIDCVAWRQTAEFVKKYFTKGEMIALIGRLQIRTWSDSEGAKRKAAEVVADSVYFCGSRRERAEPEADVPVFDDLDDDEDDLPF